MPAPTLPLPWVKAQEFYTSPSPSRLYSDNAIYVMTQLADSCGPQQQETWHLVDLKPYGVSADAQAAFLSGMLIITHGTTPETADIHMVLRRPGDNDVDTGRLMGQTCEAHVGGGQRTNMSTWVALSNGCFEFSYKTFTPGMYPDHSCYGLNFSLQAWVR